MEEYLEQFRDGKLTKSDFLQKKSQQAFQHALANPMIVSSQHVIAMIEKFLNKDITIAQLIDWVNIIWFSDAFEYNESQCDSIASVMNKLEEMDEEGVAFSDADLIKWIESLKNNIEI